MNNVLTTLAGSDVTIQKVQNHLYTKLSAKWNGTLTGYGRAHKNTAEEDVIKLEWYNSDEKDYQDVYYDDKTDATFFFILSDSDDTEDGYVFRSRAKVVFMVDLSAIFSGSERQDAQARQDVKEYLKELHGKVNITGVERGINEVFSGISTDKIKFNDIHPLHCFAITVDLFYRLQC